MRLFHREGQKTRIVDTSFECEARETNILFAHNFALRISLLFEWKRNERTPYVRVKSLTTQTRFMPIVTDNTDPAGKYYFLLNIKINN